MNKLIKFSPPNEYQTFKNSTTPDGFEVSFVLFRHLMKERTGRLSRWSFWSPTISSLSCIINKMAAPSYLNTTISWDVLRYSFLWYYFDDMYMDRLMRFNSGGYCRTVKTTKWFSIYTQRLLIGWKWSSWIEIFREHKVVLIEARSNILYTSAVQFMQCLTNLDKLRYTTKILKVQK